MPSPDDRRGDCLAQFWTDLEERAIGHGLTLRGWHRRAKALAEQSGRRGYISYPTFQRWVRSRTRLSDWGWGDLSPIVLAVVGHRERDWRPWQARWRALQLQVGRRTAAPEQPAVVATGPEPRYALLAVALAVLALLLALRAPVRRGRGRRVA